MGKRWTQEELDFVRDNATSLTAKEIAERITEKFGAKRTVNSIHITIKKYGFEVWSYYTEEEDAFLLAHHNEMSSSELAIELEKISGTKRQHNAILQHCHAMGLKCRRWNDGVSNKGKHKPLGHEITYGHYKDVYVKVDNKFASQRTADQMKNYKLKKVLVWEQNKGEPVPKGYVIVFADGDRNNFDPNNLWAVPRGILGMMNKRNWQFEDHPEIRKTAIMCCQLERETKG